MVFECVEDVASHAQLNTTDLQALAAANAFGSLASHRHQAYWEVLGIKLTTTLLRNSRTVEASVNLSPPSEQQTVLADYASTGFSLNGHPLALIRPQLKRFRIETAKVLKTYPSKRLARACGIVTHRQRPGTAKGVVFITLEDETGQVNVIVWPSLVDKYRATMLQSQLLAVYGIWQRDGEVTHLVAKRLENFDYMLNNLQTHSRNFH
jgi:error-prone DNA polymerase